MNLFTPIKMPRYKLALEYSSGRKEEFEISARDKEKLAQKVSNLSPKPFKTNIVKL